MTRSAGGIPRYRASAGPALLSAGFRPFFLLSGLTAFLAVPVWLAMFLGYVTLPTAFDPMAWHVHEMLFGFVQAAVTGFLLTAVPNWTGRMPIQGVGLGALALLFVAGRLAVATSVVIGPVAAAAIDLAFPGAVIAALGREIITGRNWRNLPMVGALGLIGSANLLMHLEVLGWAASGRVGERLGISVVLMLIGLVGGRVIPSFTRNWLVKRGSTRLPAPFGRVDRVAMAASATALVAWIAAPESLTAAALMALAAVSAFVRLARWQGRRTAAEPLVWILHVGFLWLPVGFVLVALGHFGLIMPSAALHALTGGAMTTMILAVSTRATLGHTGRALHADGRTTLIYVLAILSAVCRVGAGVSGTAYPVVLAVAAAAWIGAFGLYLVAFGPMLLTPRRA